MRRSEYAETGSNLGLRYGPRWSCSAKQISPELSRLGALAGSGWRAPPAPQRSSFGLGPHRSTRRRHGPPSGRRAIPPAVAVRYPGMTLEHADETGQPNGQGSALVRRQLAQQLLMLGSKLISEASGDRPPFLGEGEPFQAPILRVPGAGDPASLHQACYESADRALLQSQQSGQLVLGHRIYFGELPQRHHLREGRLSTVPALRLQDPAKPEQLPQSSTQLVVRKDRLIDSCISQLWEPILRRKGCSIQL